MDPLSNMFTQIRNVQAVNKPYCTVRYSKLKEAIAVVLKQEGYISDFKIEEKGIKKNLKIFLNYDKDGKSVIHSIRSISKPGRRVYFTVDKLPRVLGGIGILIVSTNKGIMTDRSARAAKLGGEVFCEIY